jgi:amphiphysin
MIVQDTAYRTTVLEPMGRYCSYFPEINEAIKSRQKKLLDYDSARAKVRKLVDRPSEDPQRLPLASIYFRSFKNMY